MGSMRSIIIGCSAAFALSLPLQGASAECAAARAPAGATRVAPQPALRIGLALGSGSMHGIAHIGVLQALEEGGVDVRVVSGTSVGALVGALWASGRGASEIERLARERDWDNVGSFSGSWQGLFSNDKLREELEGLLPKRPIEQWPRRFAAVATNLDNGHRRVFMSGDGALAVQASTAMPVIYAPVRIGTERLGDGALVEPVPVATARALGADYVIAVDVAYRPYEDSASGLAGLAFQSMHILSNSLAQGDLRDADFAIRLDVHRQLMDCGRDALVAAARDQVRQMLPQLSRSLAAEAAKRETP